MVKRKKKAILEYEFLGLKVNQYIARVGASISHKARDKRYFYSNPKVFKFDSSIEIEGSYTYPDDRVGQHVKLTIYGSELTPGEHEQTLFDYQERDEEGVLKYRKVRGELTPVYKIPDSIGYLEVRKQQWSGTAWVSPRIVSDMLTLYRTVIRCTSAFMRERKVAIVELLA